MESCNNLSKIIFLNLVIGFKKKLIESAPITEHININQLLGFFKYFCYVRI